MYISSPTATVKKKTPEWLCLKSCQYSLGALERNPHRGAEITPILQNVTLYMTYISQQAVPEA